MADYYFSKTETYFQSYFNTSIISIFFQPMKINPMFFIHLLKTVLLLQKIAPSYHDLKLIFSVFQNHSFFKIPFISIKIFLCFSMARSGYLIVENFAPRNYHSFFFEKHVFLTYSCYVSVYHFEGLYLASYIVKLRMIIPSDFSMKNPPC